MDTLDLIKQRISANKFDTTRMLSEAEIEELVSYAAEAPSAYNIQNVGYEAPGNFPRKPRLRVDEVLSFGQGREF